MLALRTRPPRPAPNMGSTQIPFPARGLNLRSNIAKMKPDEALILDNWFPSDGNGRVRGGHVSFATGIGASVGTLMEWAGPSSRKMFAAKLSSIYDITSGGAVGAADVTGLGSAYWQHENFTTSGGHFLACVNGLDAYRNYDGTTWTTPAVTGVSGADLIGVISYGSRLWFIEKGSTRAWYLGVSSISGAATAFQLGDKFHNGGKLQALGTMARDGGSGTNDLICFISSKGEVVVYHGNDPADANTWGIDGRYMAAPPVGNRAVSKIDGDTGMLTERGIISLRQLTATGLAASERIAITAAVDQGIIDDFAAYGSITGWEMIVHPRTRQAIVNVPKSSTLSTQYAMNIQTGAWCTYGRYGSPLNATCWGMFNENLYFGTAAGTVFQAERGHQDNGAEIVASIKTSFQNYSKTGGTERVTMVRPLFTASGRVLPAIRVNNDYRTTVPMTTDAFPGISGSEGGTWGTSLWGTGLWGSRNTPYAEWVVAEGIGNTSSVYMVTRTNGLTVKLNAFDVKFERVKGQGL